MTTHHLRISVGRGRSLLSDPAAGESGAVQALRGARRRRPATSPSSAGWRPIAITIWTRSSGRRWRPSAGWTTSAARMGCSRRQSPPSRDRRRPDALTIALPDRVQPPYGRRVQTPFDDSSAGRVRTAGKPLVSTAPAISAGRYVNPILDWDFPDPAVIHAPDGYYYAYATQTLRDEQWINIQVARSADLIRLGTSRRCASREARLGVGDAGFLGAERDLRRLDLLHVLFGDARCLP